jgi:hypothetical protein
MTSLGNISAAITQIGDIAFSLYNAGAWDTLTAFGKAAQGKSRLTKKDIAIERIAEEFSNPTKMSAALNWLFEKTGFARMDRLGKETLINATLTKYERMARTNPDKFRKIIEKMVPSNLVEETIADFANTDDITDNKKLVAFNTITDFQPSDLGEMPIGYISSPGGRVFYMMKTYYIKQLDVIRRVAVSKMWNAVWRLGIKEGKWDEAAPLFREGFVELMKLVAALMLMNAASDEIKDFIFQRETKFSDNVIDNGLRLIGVSRYSALQAKRDGVVAAATNLFMPPLNIVSSPERDLKHILSVYKNNREVAAGDKKGDKKEFNVWNFESLKMIPLAGMNYHFWVGGGRDRVLNRRISEPLSDSKDRLFKPDEVKAFLDELKAHREAERLTAEEVRTKRGQFFRNQAKVRAEKARKQSKTQ